MGALTKSATARAMTITLVTTITITRAIMITLDMGALTITLVTTITITRAMMITMAQYILA